MIDGRGVSLIATCEQWSRSWHDGTVVEGNDGALALQWLDQLSPVEQPRQLEQARGVVQDRLCRVYRLGQTTIDRTAVGSTVDGLDYGQIPEEIDLIAQDAEGPLGQAGSGVLDGAGLAIDCDDRLFISDRGRQTISVIDLWSGRLLRTLRLSDTRQPDRHAVGLTTDGSTVWAAIQSPAGLIRFSAYGAPVEESLSDTKNHLPADAQPTRLAILADGTLVSLWQDGSQQSWLLAADRPPFQLENAADIAADGKGIVVAPVASVTSPTQFRRLTPTTDSWIKRKPLEAAGYSGGGIVVTDGGRIGYFTKAGFRLATDGQVRYLQTGTCVTYRIDSGQPLNRWGRVLLEACVPQGTQLRFGAVTSDEETEESLPAQPPFLVDCERQEGGATPPLPSQQQSDTLDNSKAVLYKRSFPLTAWWRHEIDEPYDTYEAPVATPPGRYLWLTVELSSSGYATPRVREARIERRSHKLMRRLPAVYSQEPDAESFLHRYLGMVDSITRDLDLRATHRELLVDPRSTPVELLDWLASFMGVTLDERWAEEARRRLIEEMVQLYRMRGTPWALSRYLEIYLAGHAALGDDRRWQRPVIVEHYRLRGLGGPQLTGRATGDSASVVGFGFRIGGDPEIGQDPLVDSDVLDNGSFGTTAHRFSVLIPRPLSPEEESVVRHLLDRERPAHTSYDLCTLDAGMRVGRGLNVGLSTIVGPTGAFAHSVVGSFALGTDAILGRPSSHMSAGSTTIGKERIR